MRIAIVAVGRLRTGPEKDLIEDYLARFDRSGRPHGLGPVEVIEVDDRKGGGMAGEGKLLDAAIPPGAWRIALDERGKLISSPDFATMLQARADDGQRDMAFIIGGADGIAPALRKTCNASLSFGKMVWPHMLVRVMLAEQLYRAASIRAQSPYHRA